MKRIVITMLLLLFAGTVADARPYSLVPRTNKVVETVQKTPWKTIVAGGAAAGTMITAYKVSDGIEDGIRTAAKDHPEVVTHTAGMALLPLMIFGLIAAGIAVLVLYRILRSVFIRLRTLFQTGKD